MAVGEISGQSKIAVCLEGHGREPIHRKVDIDRTVGWFTSSFPVLLECADDVEEAVINTKEMLRKIPNHGLGYALLPELDRSAPIEIYFNYLGESEFRESCYSPGDCVAPENRFGGEISFNCGIKNDAFSLTVSCDRATYSQRTAERFARSFLKNLRKTIDFCANREEAQKTLADVDADDLEEADFDEINAMLGLL